MDLIKAANFRSHGSGNNKHKQNKTTKQNKNTQHNKNNEHQHTHTHTHTKPYFKQTTENKY